MEFCIVLFFLGILTLQNVRSLPSLWIVFFLLLINILSILIFKFKKYNLLFSCLTAGFFYCFFYTNSILQVSIPSQYENKIILVMGEIQSIPLKHPFGKEFIFKINKIDGNKLSKLLTVKLTWLTDRELRVGQKWLIYAKLKRIHGIASLGAFNYESWAFQQGIRGQGIVLLDQDAKLISSTSYHHPIAYIRERIHLKINLLKDAAYFSPWIEAILIGLKSNIMTSDWDILQKTGTNHLMAIAGLHIGMIYLFFFHATQIVLKLIPKIYLYLPRQMIALVISLIFSVFYAMLSGFSVPVQRAAFMIILATIFLFNYLLVSRWLIYSFSLLLTLLINPNIVLSVSFWLSFSTVALIIYGTSGRLSSATHLLQLIKLQYIISIGLIPITLFWYQQASLISFVANFFAVPILSMIILPIALLSLLILYISPYVANLLFMINSEIMNYLMEFLLKLSKLPFATFIHPITSYYQLIVITIGVLILLLPRGVKGKELGLILILPLFISNESIIPYGKMKVTVFDVGQGLSVLIKTAHHSLLYDTGAGSEFGFNMGKSVVLPFLRQNSIRSIDIVVISHEDNDHIGGIKPILNEISIKKIIGSKNEKILTYFLNLKGKVPSLSLCNDRQQWKWDGVLFEFFSIENNDSLTLSKNNLSCILKITSSSYSILLPGDIEKKTEYLLVKQFERKLKSTILIAPHHGSKTSINKKFIDAVNPGNVIYSTGYLNRYHFPHKNTIILYEQRNIPSWNTALTGSLSISSDNEKILINTFRHDHAHYWQFAG